MAEAGQGLGGRRVRQVEDDKVHERGKKSRVKSLYRPTLPTMASMGISCTPRSEAPATLSRRATSSQDSSATERPVRRAMTSCKAACWRARRKSAMADELLEMRGNMISG